VFLFHRALGWLWLALTSLSALALAWELAVRPLTEVGPYVTVALLAIAAFNTWGHFRDARALRAGRENPGEDKPRLPATK
jgi:hypothetical protein